MLGVAECGPAVVLVDGHPEDAERAHLRPEVGGKVVRLVDGGGARCDLVGGEAHHAVADEVRLVTEAEVEAGELVGMEPGDISGAPEGLSEGGPEMRTVIA